MLTNPFNTFISVPLAFETSYPFISTLFFFQDRKIKTMFNLQLQESIQYLFKISVASIAPGCLQFSHFGIHEAENLLNFNFSKSDIFSDCV